MGEVRYLRPLAYLPLVQPASVPKSVIEAAGQHRLVSLLIRNLTCSWSRSVVQISAKSVTERPSAVLGSARGRSFAEGLILHSRTTRTDRALETQSPSRISFDSPARTC